MTEYIFDPKKHDGGQVIFKSGQIDEIILRVGGLEQVTRCRDCKWLGRESVVAGEYRCNRTERVTGLDDFCSRAVVRDA